MRIPAARARRGIKIALAGIVKLSSADRPLMTSHRPNRSIPRFLFHFRGFMRFFSL